MKKWVVIGLIVAVLIVALIIIFYPSSEKENNVVSCAKVNETCGGGIQGPNGESNYINCCVGLSCEGYEMGVCVNKSK